MLRLCVCNNVLYVSMLMPLISCLSPRVRVIRVRARVCLLCVCVCMRVYTYTYERAHLRLHARLLQTRVYVWSHVSFFFFFHSFFPLIIKAYFMLQSVECAGNRQSVFFFPSSFSLFPFIPSLSLPLVTLRRVRRLIESEKSEKRKASEFPGVPNRSTNTRAFRRRARENHSSRAFLFFQKDRCFSKWSCDFEIRYLMIVRETEASGGIFFYDIVDMERLKVYSLIAFSKIDFLERSIINK